MRQVVYHIAGGIYHTKGVRPLDAGERPGNNPGK
jgi:hypothetical protein